MSADPVAIKVQGADTTGTPVQVALYGAQAGGGALAVYVATLPRSSDGIGSATFGGFQCDVYGHLFNGSTWDRERTPNVFKDVDLAITAGTPQTIWTPGSGKKFRLMGWCLACSAAAAAIFKDEGATLWRLPKSASDAPNQSPNIGNGYLSAAANNTLKLDVSTNCTVTGFVFGMEE